MIIQVNSVKDKLFFISSFININQYWIIDLNEKRIKRYNLTLEK
jgi:hypothetical protein